MIQKTYTLTPKDLIGLTDHKARYYVIVNNKDPDDWIAMSVNVLTAHSPDCHVELWDYEGFEVVKRETVSEEE